VSVRVTKPLALRGEIAKCKAWYQQMNMTAKGVRVPDYRRQTRSLREGRTDMTECRLHLLPPSIPIC
jgi:hypothetical protein